MIARLSFLFKIAPHHLEDTLERDPRLLATMLEVIKNHGKPRR